MSEPRDPTPLLLDFHGSLATFGFVTDTGGPLDVVMGPRRWIVRRLLDPGHSPTITAPAPTNPHTAPRSSPGRMGFGVQATICTYSMERWQDLQADGEAFADRTPAHTIGLFLGSQPQLQGSGRIELDVMPFGRYVADLGQQGPILLPAAVTGRFVHGSS